MVLDTCRNCGRTITKDDHGSWRHTLIRVWRMMRWPQDPMVWVLSTLYAVILIGCVPLVACLAGLAR